MVNNRRMEEWANTLNVPFKRATREEKSSLFGTNTTVTGAAQGEKDPQGLGMGISQGEGADSQDEDDDDNELSELLKRFVQDGGSGMKSMENAEIEAAQPKSIVPEK
ncbi:hypothetical protein Anas_05168, partial [Armadillidium nasatum]